MVKVNGSAVSGSMHDDMPVTTMYLSGMSDFSAAMRGELVHANLLTFT